MTLYMHELAMRGMPLHAGYCNCINADIYLFSSNDRAQCMYCGRAVLLEPLRIVLTKRVICTNMGKVRTQ